MSLGPESDTTKLFAMSTVTLAFVTSSGKSNRYVMDPAPSAKRWPRFEGPKPLLSYKYGCSASVSPTRNTAYIVAFEVSTTGCNASSNVTAVPVNRLICWMNGPQPSDGVASVKRMYNSPVPWAG